MSQILPGVYATINASALVSTPAVADRPVLIYGTAEKGVLDTPTLVTSLNDLELLFGSAEALTSGVASLTLVRAAALALNAQGGSAQVYCVRNYCLSSQTQIGCTWLIRIIQEGC